ncbi:uncharacterized protein [Procambarus clarkii]|uniref:uncharacterized protein isoform X2 n=1 Tax=Procambarus clarkii TaxID=6728 RepID=UPI003742CFED
MGKWMVPLVTSSVRLVLILSLLLFNVAGLWQTTTRPKYTKGLRAYERIFLNTVICLNMIYLVIIWGPFTLSAFRHDFVDLHHDAAVINDMQRSALVIGENVPEFAVQYIDMDKGEVVTEKIQIHLRFARAIEEREGSFNLLTSSDDTNLTDAVGNYSSQPFKESMSQLTTEENSPGSWDTDVQDLETSSFAYSLALTAIFRLLLARKSALRPSHPIYIAMATFLLVVIPAFTTGLIRFIGNSVPHLAPHKPEMTSAGLTIRNIICDVHITEAYVLSLFLEWAAVFTIAIVVVALSSTLKPSKTDSKDFYEKGSYTLKPSKIDSCVTDSKDYEKGSSTLKPSKTDSKDFYEKDCNSVDMLACDFVLILGTCWAWPVKPLLALILYCQYGQHWTNLVCTIAHVVIAIPVVFIPLAVFVSQQQKNRKQPTFLLVIAQGTYTKPQVASDKKQKLDVYVDVNDTKEEYEGEEYEGDEYGGDEYGEDEYEGDEYGGDEYGGDEYGGDEYGEDEYEGDEYEGDEYKGDKYEGDEYEEDEGEGCEKVAGDHTEKYVCDKFNKFVDNVDKFDVIQIAINPNPDNPSVTLKSKDTYESSGKKERKIRENLKFYLGKDILNVEKFPREEGDFVVSL